MKICYLAMKLVYLNVSGSYNCAFYHLKEPRLEISENLFSVINIQQK